MQDCSSGSLQAGLLQLLHTGVLHVPSIQLQSDLPFLLPVYDIPDNHLSLRLLHNPSETFPDGLLFLFSGIHRE